MSLSVPTQIPSAPILPPHLTGSFGHDRLYTTCMSHPHPTCKVMPVPPSGPNPPPRTPKAEDATFHAGGIDWGTVVPVKPSGSHPLPGITGAMHPTLPSKVEEIDWATVVPVKPSGFHPLPSITGARHATLPSKAEEIDWATAFPVKPSGFHSLPSITGARHATLPSKAEEATLIPVKSLGFHSMPHISGAEKRDSTFTPIPTFSETGELDWGTPSSVRGPFPPSIIV